MLFYESQGSGYPAANKGQAEYCSLLQHGTVPGLRRSTLRGIWRWGLGLQPLGFRRYCGGSLEESCMSICQRTLQHTMGPCLPGADFMSHFLLYSCHCRTLRQARLRQGHSSVSLWRSRSKAAHGGQPATKRPSIECKQPFLH